MFYCISDLFRKISKSSLHEYNWIYLETPPIDGLILDF